MIYRACNGSAPNSFQATSSNFCFNISCVIQGVWGLSETVLVSSEACLFKIVWRMVSYCLQCLEGSFSGLVFKSEFKRSFFGLSRSILLIRLKKKIFLTHFGLANSCSERTKKLSESPSQAETDLTASVHVCMSENLHVVRDQKIQEYRKI